MKKIIFAILVLAMLLSCAACAGTPASDQTSTPTSNDRTSTAPTNNTGTVYKIADYYNADGSFSALGLVLNEEDTEKVLTVKDGDTIIVDNQKYSVTAESLTLPFYTQSSLDGVIEWWKDYCDSRIERDEMTKISN